jgi:hypothetical protein
VQTDTVGLTDPCLRDHLQDRQIQRPQQLPLRWIFIAVKRPPLPRNRSRYLIGSILANHNSNNKGGGGGPVHSSHHVGLPAAQPVHPDSHFHPIAIAQPSSLSSGIESSAQSRQFSFGRTKFLGGRIGGHHVSIYPGISNNNNNKNRSDSSS